MVRQRTALVNSSPSTRKEVTRMLFSKHKKLHASRKSVQALSTSTNASKFSALKRNKSPGFSLGAHYFEGDETLVAPIADYNINETSHEEQSSEGEDWNDGQTLVSRFRDIDPDAPIEEEEDLLALVESLNGALRLAISDKLPRPLAVPFGQCTTEVKRDLVSVLVSTLDHIKQVHEEIEMGPDLRFLDGVKKFHTFTSDTCNAFSDSIAAFVQTHADAQINTVDLFKKLKVAYQKKHDARIKFTTELEAKVQTIISEFDQVDEQLQEVRENAFARLQAMNKYNQKQKNQDILKLLGLED
ncbi:hypothetical protein CPB86DRAFT_757302 [Serendipita vermifera]|nr:hypothetical protein CPB86DRAFT_757302 [Serendipita vermifera]